MSAQEIVRQCKSVLRGYYGPRFKGLVVYGSEARHEATSGSDIDLLVLLAQPFDYFRELRRIVDLLYPVQLESDRLISAKPAASDEYEQGATQLYRSVKREGVLA